MHESQVSDIFKTFFILEDFITSKNYPNSMGSFVDVSTNTLKFES